MPLFILLLLALLFFGLGFTVKALWYIAVILVVIWLISAIRARGP